MQNINKEVINNLKDKISFGMYKGLSYYDIINDNEDPGYILWLNNNTTLNFTESILNYCNQCVIQEQGNQEIHSDYGNRD